VPTFDFRFPGRCYLAGLGKVALLIIAIIAASPANAQTALDGFDPPITGGDVDKVIIDDDGKILIGGEFSVAGEGRVLIMRNWPGGERHTGFSLDFVPPEGGIRAIVPRPGPAGGYLVGGDFSGPGYSSNLAVVTHSGQAENYNIAVNDTVVVIERTSDDPSSVQYYIGGSFTSVSGASRHQFARLNSNQNLDLSFQPPEFEGVGVTAVQPLPDGKVLVGGWDLRIPGAPQAGSGLFRLNSDGSLDESFVFDALPTPNVIQLVLSIEVQADGRILIAGNLDASAGGETRKDILRLMPDGSVDLSFETSSETNAAALDLALQPDGRMVVVGNFSNLGLSSHIARLESDGDVDNSFALFVDPNTNVRTVAVQGDGGVLFGGGFTEITGVPFNGVARIRKEQGLDVDLDGSGNGSGNGSVHSVGIDTSGNLFIGGAFTVVQGETRTHLARLAGITGTVSTGFNPIIDGPVHAVLVQPDGKVVIGGEFTLVNSVQRLRLARLNTDGSLDTSFNPTLLFNGAVYALAQAPDGKIYFGGSFEDAGGSGRDHFARLNADGSLDTGFNDTGVDDTVRAIALDWDQYRIYIAGDFTMVGDFLRPRLARVWPSGNINNGFNIGGHHTLSRLSLAPMPDGGVLAGLGGTSIGIQRWSEDGSLDPTFDAGGINGPVNSIVRDQTGNIYIGGGFTEVGGLSRQRLARLWSNGWVDIAFSDTPITFGTVPAPATVHSMLLEGNGKLVAAGEFSQVDGQGRRNIARVSHRIGIPAERLTVESNGSVIWKREHGGPELRSAPQLMMSATCCSSGDFELLPGSMEWDPVNSTWVYDAFPNSFGTYYLKTRARIGGTGGGVMESPIHQFYGGPVPVSEAELAIEMVADRQVANVGDPVTFELTVTNTGPDPATQVVTEVSLPSGFAYESHQLSQGSYDPVTGIWAIGVMNPKGSATEALMKIDAVVNATGPYQFQTKVQSEAFDPFTGNNIASVLVTVLPQGDTIFADQFEQP